MKIGFESEVASCGVPLWAAEGCSAVADSTGSLEEAQLLGKGSVLASEMGVSRYNLLPHSPDVGVS